LGWQPQEKNQQFLLSLFIWVNVNSTRPKANNNNELKSNQKAHHECQIRPVYSHKANRPWGKNSRISLHSWTPTAPESFKHKRKLEGLLLAAGG
jgi:hypothetical protein